MEQCIVAMLDDEESQQINNTRNNTAEVNYSVNGLSDTVNNLSISSNGVRNSDNVQNYSSDNTVISNNPRRTFSAQERL